MQTVIIKANLTQERGRWLVSVSSRVMGLAPSEVITSGSTPDEAITTLSQQLSSLLGVNVILMLEAT
jgi:hypothetical protein